MGTSQNWLGAMAHVADARLEDALAHARRILERNQPELERLNARLAREPALPANWHRRAVARALSKPQTARIYFAIRRALWGWPEFASVSCGARAILEVVIELARDEAFPWYVSVPAEDVRRLARLAEGSYARSVRELECLALSRPGVVIEVADHHGLPRWKSMAWNGTKLGPGDGEAAPIAQFVLRYRRGIPWNKKRAAWWINYDLLMETGRVMPCFVVAPANLARPYFTRNRAMAGDSPGLDSPEAMTALVRRLARSGPLPEVGLRAAFWAAGLNQGDLNLNAPDRARE